jgi:Apea-like HEPN
MSWCFRLRFDLSKRVKLEFDGAEWVIVDNDSTQVVMHPADGSKTIAEAKRLSLHGGSYGTKSLAAVAGERWRDWLILAFSNINVGVDFGDRAPPGEFTSYALAVASSAAETQVLKDVHGLMTYECDPRPVFLRVGPITGIVSSPHERLVEALNRAIAAEATLTPRGRLAYDLYSASFLESNTDARFVMLMMAVETLIELQARSAEAQELVNKLIDLTRNSGLSTKEIASIQGALRWLRQESINQAGRRLASTLRGRTYGEEDPETFFVRCYDLRSRLVHGATPRPMTSEIGLRAAYLEHFVSNLICGSLLDNS